MPYWCCDCNHPVELDRHGRCDSCGSDAVDILSRIPKVTTISTQAEADRWLREQWQRELQEGLEALGRRGAR